MTNSESVQNPAYGFGRWCDQCPYERVFHTGCTVNGERGNVVIYSSDGKQVKGSSKPNTVKIKILE